MGGKRDKPEKLAKQSDRCEEPCSRKPSMSGGGKILRYTRIKGYESSGKSERREVIPKRIRPMICSL